MLKNIQLLATMVSAGIIAAAGMPALADTNASATIGIMRVERTETAADAREKAITAAFTAYTQTMNAAYAARATALTAAYRNDDAQEVAAAVKMAWGTFADESRRAHNAWRTARDRAWKEFRASVQANT